IRFCSRFAAAFGCAPFGAVLLRRRHVCVCTAQYGWRDPSIFLSVVHWRLDSVATVGEIQVREQSEFGGDPHSQKQRGEPVTAAERFRYLQGRVFLRWLLHDLERTATN